VALYDMVVDIWLPSNDSKWHPKIPTFRKKDIQNHGNFEKG
jgi:hypothetical protein